MICKDCGEEMTPVEGDIIWYCKTCGVYKIIKEKK